MIIEDDYLYIKEELSSENPTTKSIVLRGIISDPTGDERVIKLIKQYIDDDTPCIVSIPYLVGEIRYLATRALSKELQLLDKVEKKSVQVVQPLSIDELGIYKKKHDVESIKSGFEGTFDSFIKLREIEALPIIEIEY